MPYLSESVARHRDEGISPVRGWSTRIGAFGSQILEKNSTLSLQYYTMPIAACQVRVTAQSWPQSVDKGAINMPNMPGFHKWPWK